MSNRESMRYPSVDQLTAMTSSKYKLVIAAAKRAKEIELDEKTYIEHPVNKSDTINIDDKNIDFNLLTFIKSPLN